MFRKMWTPSFSFYNFSKSWSILMKIILLTLLRIFLTTVFLLTELQDQEHATRTGVQDQN